MLGVRPEDIALSPAPSPESTPVKVVVVELLGSENIINVTLAGHIVKVRTPPTFRPTVGEILHATIEQNRAHLFDAKTEENLHA